MYNYDDTIAAISTPHGTGGIAIIRISGSNSIEIAKSVLNCKINLGAAESHKAYLAKVFDKTQGKTSQLLDEVLVTIFRSPKSYTTEDLVEISCHGGRYLSRRVLQLILDNGARMARRGEFTERAFLNGRLDLSQAEAVADIIAAKTDWSLRSAIAQFQGGLSRKIRKIRNDLIEIAALLELELDFAEEDVEFTDKSDILIRLQKIISEIESFLQTYRRGKIYREGAKLTIVGKPNVGKSSILNALLKEERAIVTEISGTTRDVLEEQLDIQGVLFRIVDTAGIRKTQSVIEKEGVKRSFQQIKDADIVLFVFDGSKKLTERDIVILKEVLSKKKQTIFSINKSDLPLKLDLLKIQCLVNQGDVIRMSAKTHDGLSALEKKLIEVATGNKMPSQTDVVLTNVRQKKALQEAIKLLRSAESSLKKGLSSEFVAQDFRDAVNCLGEIIGEVTTEDILGVVFSRFCIGK